MKNYRSLPPSRRENLLYALLLTVAAVERPWYDRMLDHLAFLLMDLVARHDRKVWQRRGITGERLVWLPWWLDGKGDYALVNLRYDGWRPDRYV